MTNNDDGYRAFLKVAKKSAFLQFVLGIIIEKEWNENKHPRDERGRFVSVDADGKEAINEVLTEYLQDIHGFVVSNDGKRIEAKYGGEKYHIGWFSKENNIEVEGASKTEEYIMNYKNNHNLDLDKESEKYLNVLNDVQNFGSIYPDAEEGTYDATTGGKVDISDGYSVTFHQNHSISEPYEDYSSKSYASMCAISRYELSSNSVYIGYFGNAEVSFHCKNIDTAMEFAIAHNQHSIYGCESGEIEKNPFYNKNYNPIEGH